jgi:predicted DNA-binding WGR domain protein
MSQWAVDLAFVEGGSSKFWRARVDGGVLYVNFGRIGTGGQVQMKDLGSPDAALKEMDKLIREKRKKGYEDAGSVGAADGADEEEEDDEEDEPRPKKKAAPAPAKAASPAAAPPPPAPAPVVSIAPPRAALASFVLDVGGQKITTRAILEGTTVSIQSTESHGDPGAAAAAFERLRAALLADGHREA